MMKFQTKPNCQNSLRAFQSNKTLSVQTEAFSDTVCWTEGGFVGMHRGKGAGWSRAHMTTAFT